MTHFNIYIDGKRPKPPKIHSPKCERCRHRHDEHRPVFGCTGNIWIGEATSISCSCGEFKMPGGLAK